MTEIYNPFREGMSEDEMWAEYSRVCKRLERAQNRNLNVPYYEWCELVRKESEMRRYLNSRIWGSDKPLNLPSSKEEKLSRIQSMPSDERHRLFLCDFRVRFESALDESKSGAKSWAFEADFNKLKTYKKIHGWDNAYIERVFGVSFKEAKNLYYSLRK